jgi:3-oxoacyl-[acyl-carrier-protein] synthase-3
MNHHSTAYGSIVGLVAAVPDRIITNADCPDPVAADEAAKLTGVRERRWVREGQTAYDLNLAAANRVLAGMGWAGSELDLIVYVTQTPSRAVPADVYSLAAAVGATCPCMQVNWSCSGYVYGLWTAMRMLSAGQRALLVVGDATSTIADKYDRATGPLFGDAGSATAIIGGGPEQHFVMGTDGTGAEKLSCRMDTDYAEDSGPYLEMDGAAVFNFTLKRVPMMLEDVLRFGRPHFLLFHQANRFMLEHLARKMDVGRWGNNCMPVNIDEFGNTSCASIPLLFASKQMGDLTASAGLRCALLGFGAGWAWAGAMIEHVPMHVCELIEV